MNQTSHYKIVMDKIFFSDRRMDYYFEEINNVFKIFDGIEGRYVPPKTLEEWKTGEFQRIIDLHNNLRRKVTDCRHKTMSARYSLALIEGEVKTALSPEEMRAYSEMIRNQICSEAELKNEVLINETEAFIFQVRSNLDIIIQLLKYIYTYLDLNKNIDKESLVFGRSDGTNTTDLMRNNSDLEMADFFDNEIKGWIAELNELRNEIAHRSGLIGFSNFVYQSKTGKVIVPQMPNGEEVYVYCKKIFDNLLSLYCSVAEKFVLTKV